MLPAQVDAETPPLGRRQAAVGWEVIGPTEVVGRGWRAPVVGIAEVVARGQTLAAV